MPGIFIGIGGIGGSIVSETRQELELRVAWAGDTPSARSAAGQFKFFLLDTWRDGVALGFDASECFDLPDGKDKFDIDTKIDAWYFGRDPAFPKWWPSRNEMHRGPRNGRVSDDPLKVGAFASGAGQLRVKGKLAYRIALTGQRPGPVTAVREALNRIDSVLEASGGIRIVPIYLVCSLGGGTGSGMVLTFAQHLRQVMPGHCQIIGVFPLAGITEMGPGSADHDSIWANTDAALREIDYCQRVAGTPENKLTPFFQWPGEGNVLFGRKRPFDYIYLFGRGNEDIRALTEFPQYVRLIAETLVAESFSDLLDEGLQTGISGSHSQFVMQLESRREIAGRPTSYASAAVGALVYPAERIERHLARRYTVAVLDRLVQVNRGVARAAADEFLKGQALLWQSVPNLEAELLKPVVNADGKSAPLQDIPAKLKLNPETDPDLARANRDKTRASAEAAFGLLNDYSRVYIEHLKRRQRAILAQFQSPTGGLREAVRRSLATRGPAALGMTHEIVRLVRLDLEAEWRTLDRRLVGAKDAAEQQPGLNKSLAARQERWAGDLKTLDNGFGRGFSAIFNRNGKKAKSRFYKQTWSPLLRETLERERLLRGRELYQELAREAQRVERTLEQLIDQVGALRADLERSTRTDVGKHGRTGALDLAILDDPLLVAHRFDTLLEQVTEEGVDQSAIAVTTHMERSDEDGLDDEPQEVAALAVERGETPRTGIVMDTLDRKLDAGTGETATLLDTFRDQLEQVIVDDGARRLAQGVRSLSVWDALDAECKAREKLPLHDKAMSDALNEVRQRRARVEDAAGLARDWERELLKAFIRRKLVEFQVRGHSFWDLKTQMGDFGNPHKFTIIATDERAYREAETTLGIEGVLDGTAQLLNAGAPKWLPNRRDRIIMYTRQGVVPLFYLNDDELKGLRDATGKKADEKFLYTDRRFAQAADAVIRPGESVDDQLKYTVALALQFEILGRAPLNGHDTEGWVFRTVSKGKGFETAMDLENGLKTDHTFYRAVRRKVDEQMSGVASAERFGVLEGARGEAERLHDEAASARRFNEARWWKAAERTVQTRLTYGQYHVN